jgi:predicted glycoside hydrolase/deacetylase ChbG (UPF0249 family)
MKPSLLRRMAPWPGDFPEVRGTLGASFILPLPCGAQGLLDPQRARQYLFLVRRFLQENFPGSHEILLAPFNSSVESSRWRALNQDTFRRHPYIFLKDAADGVGEAVRAGVFRSRGRKILVGSLECYFSPVFFRQALEALDAGQEAVRANRRRPESEFVVTANLLSMIYRRHVWGVLMNRFLRNFLPLASTDGLSGAMVMERDHALRSFNRLTCPGYLYEIELEIQANVNNRPWTDLPAAFLLEREKSLHRVVRESLEALVWLPRFQKMVDEGKYAFLKRKGNKLTADDWGLSHGINDGILELARLGHLRRVSLLADAPYLTYRLQELKRIPHIEFGIHFNLTAPYQPQALTLPRLLWAWFRRREEDRGALLDHARSELERQLGVLERHRLKILRFDSHHHVHTLPGLLDAVADILRRKGIRYVRVPYNPSLWKGSKALVAYLGHGMAAHGLAGFRSLPFVYPDAREFATVNRLVRMLNRTEGSEVLIHPAAYDDLSLDAPFDSLRKARVDEYQSLRLLALELRLPLPKNRRRKTKDAETRPYVPAGSPQLPGPFLTALAAVLIPS